MWGQISSRPFLDNQRINFQIFQKLNQEKGELEDHEIICPRHGARFDISNGKVTALPVIEDIPSYPVKIADDEILIGIPNS